MGDQLGDHRVVEGRDRIPFLNARIDSSLIAQLEMLKPTDARQKPLGRILGVEPRLDRVAGDRQLILRLRQRLPARHPQLPLDQVLPGNLLGHRMLDLQPRVHLHEPDAVGLEAIAGVGDELDRPRALVIDRLRRFDRRSAHRFARRCAHPGRRRFLDHFLVAALQ